MSDATETENGHRKVPLTTPRLEQRMKKYGIELPTFAPITDRIFVHPLDKEDQPDTTAGGIILADTTKASLGAQRGLLIMAGPVAIEQLYSHGVALGDIIITSRFSPLERRYFSKNRKPGRVLILRAAEVVGSEDLLAGYESGEIYVTMDNAGHTRLNDSEIILAPIVED